MDGCPSKTITYQSVNQLQPPTTCSPSYSVSEVCGHQKVVLDDKGGLLRVHDKAFDDPGCHYPLLRIKIGTGFIDEVDVSWNTKCKHDGDTLKFTTGQILDFLIDKIIQLEGFVDIRLKKATVSRHSAIRHLLALRRT